MASAYLFTTTASSDLSTAPAALSLTRRGPRNKATASANRASRCCGEIGEGRGEDAELVGLVVIVAVMVARNRAERGGRRFGVAMKADAVVMRRRILVMASMAANRRILNRFTG